MLESVRCPNCSAHYGLKASRVRQGIRRAKCFSCDTVFGIEAEVLRLLGPAALPAETAAEPANLDFLFEESAAIEPGDLLEAVPEPAQAAEPQAPPEPEPDTETPPLTLGDLEDEDLLEKTLIQAQPSPAPEMGRDEIPAAPEADTGMSYASAREAIDRLMGTAPMASAATRPAMVPTRGGQMDVEATLSALEKTLGGLPSQEAQPAPMTPPFPPSEAPAAATLKLNAADIQAAIAPRMAQAPMPEAPAAPEAQTTFIPRLQTGPADRPALMPTQPSAAPSPSGDMNLLKVQVGSETFQNLSVEQVSRWIEEGRIMDYHMVARQFSDNWIEASKVPSLRPVFERVRRKRAGVPDAAPTFSASETAPIKKSLFGGLFKS